MGFPEAQDPGGAWEEGEKQRGDHPVAANATTIDLVLSVAEAAAETSLEGGNMALAIFIPVLIISLLLGGAYIYLTRWGCRGWHGAGASIALASHTPRSAGRSWDGGMLFWNPLTPPLPPAGVGTTPASACPSCTPTPTARSR